MKTLILWISILCALIVIGCGGGGGSSTGTTSTNSNSGDNGGSTGINTGIIGFVRDVADQPISNAKVIFYNGSFTQVGQAVTNANGKFGAELPTSTKRFTIDISNIPNASNYFAEFGYGNLDYLTNDVSCTAAAPTVVSGKAVALPHDIVITQLWFGPPPPPEGCVKG